MNIKVYMKISENLSFDESCINDSRPEKHINYLLDRLLNEEILTDKEDYQHIYHGHKKFKKHINKREENQSGLADTLRAVCQILLMNSL